VNLLVAIDFSAVTDDQLRVATRLAGPGGSIHILHVAEPDPSFIGLEAGPPEVQEQVAREFRQEQETLEAMAARLREAGHAASARLVRGPTVQTILEEAGTLGADVIIVGSHGRGKLFDLVVGSVSAGVIRKAAVPVLVVPSR
jgi:nucleotide-binding universal stress UspA family protein